MIDLIKDIQEWHEKTFPEFTAKDQEMKLGEEISEYSAAIDTLIATGLQSDLEKIKEELADVIIAAVNLLRFPEIQRLSKLKWQPTNKGLGKMDTTTDYKALYLKKFFQWQEISHQQRIRIEELEAKLKTATNAIQSVINEPGLMDAGMLMFLTSALNKIKE